MKNKHLSYKALLLALFLSSCGQMSQESTSETNFLESIKDSIIDVGSRAILNAEGAKAEVISRAVAQDESQIFARGHLAGNVPNVKGHLECQGLVLSDDSFIYAVPELEASSTNLEMSHEAAVGKISEDEINYLTSRGIPEEEAESMIVRGFLNMDITGRPEELAQQTQNRIDMSLD